MSSSTPRRSFVGSVLAGTAAVAGSAVFGRDLGAQQQLFATQSGSAAAPVSETWDMSWVDRITGKYRQVFDSPEIEQGTALVQTRTWMNGYAEVYGAKSADMSAVLVIRHAAIPMILNDTLWDELELGGQVIKSDGDSPPPDGSMLQDPVTGEPARRNPFLSSSMQGDPKYAMIYPNGGFDSLMAEGAIVIACNLALRRPIGMVMRRDKVDNASAKAKVLANIVPGVVIMPSGIFATARAQEAGCTFMHA